MDTSSDFSMLSPRIVVTHSHLQLVNSLDLAYRLLVALPSHMICDIVDKVKPRTKCDFLTTLPAELALNILCNLDISSLGRCAQVSTSWNRLVEDTDVWRTTFLGKYTYPPSPAYRRPGMSSRCSSSNELVQEDKVLDSAFVHVSKLINVPGSIRPVPKSVGLDNRDPLSAPPPPPPYITYNPKEGESIDWRYMLKQRLRLDENWRCGRIQKITLTGHAEGIYCSQFMGNILATGSKDYTVHIWDLETMTRRAVLEGHQASVLSLQFNSMLMVTGSSDTMIMLWDMRSFKPITALKGHTDSVLNVKLDGGLIVSGSKDQTVRIWDMKTGQTKVVLRGHSAAVNAVQVHAASDTVISASGDRTIRIWQASTGKCVRVLAGHQRGIACIHYLPHKHLLASGSSDETVKIWCTKSGKCLRTLIGHGGLVRSVQIDNEYVVSGGYDESVKVWRHSGRPVLDLKGGHSGRVFSLQFDSTKIVSCSQDRYAVIWDFSEGVDTRMFQRIQ